jgi:PAS domain S-box-containing protein
VKVSGTLPVEIETTLRNIFDGSNFIIGVLELVGDTVIPVTGNAAFIGLLGDPLDSAHPCVQHCRKSRPDSAPVRFEYAHLTPARKIWLRAAVAHLGECERRPRFSFLAEDITEHKLARESLQISLERLDLAQKAANAGAWEWDMVTGKLTWSDALFQLFGLPATATPSFDTWNAILHPEDRFEVQEGLKRAIEHRQPARGEYRIKLADGSIRWIDAVGRVFCDDAGKPLHMYGICIDVTDRVRTDLALREKHEQLSSILNAAVDAIVTIDQHGVVVSVNPATQQMFGYVQEEMIGENVSMLMPAPFAEEHDSYLRRFLSTGKARVIGSVREFHARRKDGTVFPIDLTVSELKPLKLFTGIIRDISQRKELEREIVEIAVLEQQRIGQDLHDDCGQELTALGLLADTLVESLRQNSPEDASVAVKMEQGLRRVLRRIRSISRGLAQMEIQASDHPGALMELASRLSETSGVRCTFEGDETVRVTESAQATQLYHIAQEACTNALKHSQATAIQIKLRAQADGAALEIRDNGIGIARQVKEGLGMRILRNRAAVIGARLSVQRGKPRGTVVTCILPPEQTREEKARSGGGAKPHPHRR